MDVSKTGGFSPQIIHFNRVFHYKPSILGYHYFWKHPYTWDILGYVFLTLTHPPPQKINTQLFVWNWIVQTQTYYHGTWNIYLREFLNGLNSWGNEGKYSIFQSHGDGRSNIADDFGTKNTPLPGLPSFTGNFFSPRRRPKCRTFQMLNLHLSKLHRERSQSRGMGDGSILKSSRFWLPLFLFFFPYPFCFFFLRLILRAGSKESSNLHTSCGDFQTQIKYSSHIPSTI